MVSALHFVRRLLHSVQAADALLILISSTPLPSGGGGGGGGTGSGSVLGAMGRKGLDGPWWAIVYKCVYQFRREEKVHGKRRKTD